MRLRHSVIRVVVLAFGMAGPAGGGVGWAADWHDELARQIAHDEGCEVAFVSQVIERDINGKRLIMAKVHCEDKRSFDAMRVSDDFAFEFKACEVPNAETC
jgi:hypothetical protein